MERKLARIAKIESLSPIPGADLIELATYKGWKFVVKKGEFQVGNTGVYFEIDSILDHTNPAFAFLMKDGKMPYLRTKRLKGQISQGLMLPIGCLRHYGDFAMMENTVGGETKFVCNLLLTRDGKVHRLEPEYDVTQLTNTIKYEPEIPAQLAGLIKSHFPSFIPKTDQERIQNVPTIIDEIGDAETHITIKYDGTSGTYYYRDGVFGVCSRNLELKDSEDNTYWKMARKYDIENKLKYLGRNIAIQGEICGPGIQKNRLGLKEIGLFVFAIFDIDKQEYISPEARNIICEHLQLEQVMYYHSRMPLPFKTIEEALELVAKCTYPHPLNGSPIEGFVIETSVPTFSPTLNGRISFKVISNKYLEKHNL